MLQHRGLAIGFGAEPKPSSSPRAHPHAVASRTSPVRLAGLVRPSLNPEAARRPTTQLASSSAVVSSSINDDREGEGVLSVFRRFRGPTLCLAGIALWACLSSGQLTSPFASSSMSMPIVEHTVGGMTLTAQSAWAGLAAGVLHTLCGPDHLAGLAPLSIGRTRTVAAALGALWGFGHSTGQFMLGVAFALLKERFEDFTPIITKWSGIIVPLTLMLIGFMGIYESCFAKDEEQEHQHDIPGSIEGSQDGDLALAGGGSVTQSRGRQIGIATYVTGIIHGLSPDALVVVIPALALPTKLASIAYISLFVIGTCVSMGAYTLILGSTAQALSKDKPWLQAHLSAVASIIAISVGVLMLLAEFGLNVPLFS